MSTEENKAVVRRFFGGLDEGNSAVVEDVYAPGFALHFPGMPGPLDREAAGGFFDGLFAAFPGIQHPIKDMVAEGDRVAARITIHGTHQGEFQGIPATGREVKLSAIDIFRFEGGKIAEQWVELDALGMMQQLGVIPAPETA